MSEAARQEFVHKVAWELNLIPEEEAFLARLGKKLRTEPKSSTAMLALDKGKGKLIGKARNHSRLSSVCSVCKCERSQSPEPQQSPSTTSVPSVAHPMVEDDTTTLTGSPVVERPLLQSDPAPLVSSYCSSCALSISIHGPGNQMETDDYTPPPVLAAINLVDNFGQLVSRVCDIFNPWFKRMENALSNVDTQFKMLHETLAKLVQPPVVQNKPNVPVEGTFSWDDILEEILQNNKERIPIAKLIHEGHNPFTWEECIQKQVEEDRRLGQGQAEGRAYMAEHGLDQEEFPQLPGPTHNETLTAVAAQSKKVACEGKEKARIVEANAKVPGAAPYANSKDASQLVASSSAPDQTRGHVKIKQTKLKPMFATVTAAAIGQHETQGVFIKAKKQSQHLPQVQLRPGATFSTEVTVIRHGGVGGENKVQIQARLASSIVSEV